MKTNIESIIVDLDLIKDIVPDYKAGRKKGLSDKETEQRAIRIFVNTINLVGNLSEAIDSGYFNNLENFIKCCTAYRDENGKCKGYQVSRYNENIADRCKGCEEFEGS